MTISLTVRREDPRNWPNFERSAIPNGLGVLSIETDRSGGHVQVAVEKASQALFSALGAHKNGVYKALLIAKSTPFMPRGRVA
jgi:hypothetical protein